MMKLQPTIYTNPLIVNLSQLLREDCLPELMLGAKGSIFLALINLSKSQFYDVWQRLTDFASAQDANLRLYIHSKYGANQETMLQFGDPFAGSSNVYIYTQEWFNEGPDIIEAHAEFQRSVKVISSS